MSEAEELFCVYVPRARHEVYIYSWHHRDVDIIPTQALRRPRVDAGYGGAGVAPFTCVEYALWGRIMTLTMAQQLKC